jgi:UDP-N-acetylmuramoyl-tripeptide--D-alanyl-D-alanine ligase
MRRACALAAAAAALSGCCGSDLIRTVDRAQLDESLALGTRFLLANQRPEGNFNYEYDWKTRTQNPDDNQVRQVGAMWGLALLYHAERQPKVAAALDRSLAFFEQHSRVTPAGERFVVYPGESKGASGSIALFALTLIDYQRADPPHLTAERRAELAAMLDQLLAELVRLRMPDGHWYGGYELTDGSGRDAPNPYVDGESLLALIKAAKYLGRDDLRPAIEASAKAGYRDNVVEARRKHRDSDTTKGYYQWSSMSFYELFTSGWPGTEVWAARTIELAYWMIDVHHTLARLKNTAYAYEGLISAWELARLTGDHAAARKIGRVIERGMTRLSTWQVGSPLANDCIRSHPTDDPLAIGGVQNHAHDAPLRIDVTQHQMHAVILARRFYWRE